MEYEIIVTEEELDLIVRGLDELFMDRCKAYDDPCDGNIDEGLPARLRDVLGVGELLSRFYDLQEQVGE